MKDPAFAPTAAAMQYAIAYAAHYSSKDLLSALRLYVGVLSDHPNEQEAGFSRSQIQNLVQDVVPPQELMAAQIALALARLEHAAPPAGSHRAA